MPDSWSGVEQLSNRTASVYLRALLLTGVRREEIAALKWADVDFQWRKLTIADKVEATRVIPLTPYLAQQLAALPRINELVFASTGNAGRITDTRASRAKALQSAGIDYSLNRWPALTQYLHDGNVAINNNHCENLVRPWAMGRNNAKCIFMRSLSGGLC